MGRMRNQTVQRGTWGVGEEAEAEDRKMENVQETEMKAINRVKPPKYLPQEVKKKD